MLLLAGGAMTLLSRSPPDAYEGGRVGEPAPALAGRVLLPADTGTFSLSGEPARTVLVNFWASWCGPCREEHAVLMDLARAGVPIVGVNYRDRREPALEWLHDRGNPYERVITDPEGTLGGDWGVSGIPVTVVVDRNGIVRYRHAGALTDEIVRERVLRFFPTAARAVGACAQSGLAALSAGESSR